MKCFTWRTLYQRCYASHLIIVFESASKLRQQGPLNLNCWCKYIFCHKSANKYLAQSWYSIHDQSEGTKIKRFKTKSEEKKACFGISFAIFNYFFKLQKPISYRLIPSQIWSFIFFPPSNTFLLISTIFRRSYYHCSSCLKHFHTNNSIPFTNVEQWTSFPQIRKASSSLA